MDGVPAGNPSPPAVNDPVVSEFCALARPQPMVYGTAPELAVLGAGLVFGVAPVFGEDVGC